ncbi:HNH endonuclease [Longimycelium tulufanense]|uniref:HNH endonuclease n=1 Tax=Longimycelium tulufanense TaxID=907463 RepID=UPI00166ADC0B
MPWEGSRRAGELPEDWLWRRQQILRRDRYRCQLRWDGCLGTATEVDHVRRGSDHRPTNLRAACRSCHAKKSSREGNATQARLRQLRFRPREQHPGRHAQP